MSIYKVINFLSEIGAFLKNTDAYNVMCSIMDVIKCLNMSEMSLFGVKSCCNNVYSLLQVFQTLLLFPSFMVRNPYNYDGSSLNRLMDCKKDVLYRFMNKPGMSFKELKQRFTKKRNEEEALPERIREYSRKKTDLMIDMIKRAIKRGIKFRYVLADSWFANKEIIRFIHSRHIKCDYLGMIKLLVKRSQKKYSRKLHCHYMTADMTFGDVPVLLSFVKRNKKGAWSGLITTNTTLNFFEAYGLHSQRWFLEVKFKESKSLLGLGKCQAYNLASQIAVTSLTALQYNTLSLVKRFAAYETMGELFRDVFKDFLELSITEQIWGALQEVVISKANLFGLTDKYIYDAIINRSEEMNLLLYIYELKLAS